jgi:hypothetical protein
MVYENKALIGHIEGPSDVLNAEALLNTIFEHSGKRIPDNIDVEPTPTTAGKPKRYSIKLLSSMQAITEEEAGLIVTAVMQTAHRIRDAGIIPQHIQLTLKVDNLPGLQAARYGHPGAVAAELGLVGLELGFVTKQPSSMVLKILSAIAVQTQFAGKIYTEDIRRTVLRKSELEVQPESIYFVRTNRELAYHAAIQSFIKIRNPDMSATVVQARLPTILEDVKHEHMLYASTLQGSMDRSTTGGIMFWQLKSKAFANDPGAILTAYRPRAWGAENNPNVRVGHYFYVVLRDAAAAQFLLTKVKLSGVRLKPIEIKPRQQKKGK